MTQNTSNIQDNHDNESSQILYKHSWVNRLTNFVAGLKIPSAVFYLVIWAIFFITLTILRWKEGVYSTGTLNPSDLVMSATGIFFIALIQYLDQWAIKKMQVFRDAMLTTDQEFNGLVYQLSTLPVRSTIIACFISLGFGASTFLFSPNSYAFLNLNFSSLSGGLQLINFLFSWFVFGALSYHAYRQLNLGSQATAEYIQINLFNLDPIYAFAGLTLRTALGWLIIAYAWALTTPDLLGNIIIDVTILFMQVVAVLTFVLPLLSAHGRIVEKKYELLHNIGRRLDLIINEMSKSKGTQDDLSKLRDNFSTLTMTNDWLQKLPTWPWRPGTVNSLVSAILIPNVIWFLQIILERFIFQ
ncbi:MAG: hypothetical protein WBL25_10510 [Anaerolineales bacterium]